jgi:hypothetical protein
MKTIEEKLGQEPAFPAKKLIVTGKEFSHYTNDNGIRSAIFKDIIEEVKFEGISKRFYAACEHSINAYKWASKMSTTTLKEILLMDANEAWIPFKHFPIAVAKIQYMLADELLKAENE